MKSLDDHPTMWWKNYMTSARSIVSDFAESVLRKALEAIHESWPQ